MSIAERIRAALHSFSAPDASRAAAGPAQQWSSTQTFVPQDQGMAGGIGWYAGPQGGRTRDYTSEAGPLWAGSAVAAYLRWIRRNFAQAQPKVYKKDRKDGKWKPIDGHPLERRLLSPSPRWDWAKLCSAFTLSAVCDGNAYFHAPPSGTGVAELRYLPYTACRPKPDPAGKLPILGFDYTSTRGTQWLKPEEVLYITDGTDPSWSVMGRSELKSQMLEICTDNDWAVASSGLARNLGVPGFAIFTEERMNDNDVKLLREQWADRQGGEGQGKPFVVPRKGNAVLLGAGVEKMALDKLRKVPVARIGGALGVDPMVVALADESKTFANQKDARRAAWTDCLIPLQRVFALAVQAHLMPLYEDPDLYWFDFDRSEIDALREDRDALSSRVREEFKVGLYDRATAKSLLGLTVTPDDDGVYYFDLAAGNAPGKPEDDELGAAA